MKTYTPDEVLDNRKLPLKTFQRIAYHEAAHCVLPFLLRHRGSIDYIDMGCKKDKFACVSLKSVTISKKTARREMISVLLGPAAEQKRRGKLFESGEILLRRSTPRGHIYFESQAWDGDENQVQSLAAMSLGYRTHDWMDREDAQDVMNKISRVMVRCATWTVELIAEPRVWQVVSGLADRLEPEMVMDGATAWKIMEESWGECSGLPLKKLGRKWSRRLL